MVALTRVPRAAGINIIFLILRFKTTVVPRTEARVSLEVKTIVGVRFVSLDPRSPSPMPWVIASVRKPVRALLPINSFFVPGLRLNSRVTLVTSNGLSCDRVGDTLMSSTPPPRVVVT